MDQARGAANRAVPALFLVAVGAVSAVWFADRYDVPQEQALPLSAPPSSSAPAFSATPPPSVLVLPERSEGPPPAALPPVTRPPAKAPVSAFGAEVDPVRLPG